MNYLWRRWHLDLGNYFKRSMAHYFYQIFSTIYGHFLNRYNSGFICCFFSSCTPNKAWQIHFFVRECSFRQTLAGRCTNEVFLFIYFKGGVRLHVSLEVYWSNAACSSFKLPQLSQSTALSSGSLHNQTAWRSNSRFPWARLNVTCTVNVSQLHKRTMKVAQ